MQRLEKLKAGIATPGDEPVLATKAPRAGADRALGATLVPRKVSRTKNQRSEFRHFGLAGTAMVSWDEGLTEFEVKVVNISERGLMIEAEIDPPIGQPIEIAFEGFDPLCGRVVWRKGPRIGIDLGEDSIDLHPED
jgi:hypothetical protein